MKEEFELLNAKSICTKDALGYREVMEAFGNAQEIVIQTYNISAGRNALLNVLKRVPENCKLTIITNIPKRFRTYYGDGSRQRARETIHTYIERLNPEGFQSQNVSVWFCFENHAKIIMTDSIAYIGSSNYSDESKQNFEAGIVFKNPGFTEYWHQNIWPIIMQTAIPYFKHTEMLTEARAISIEIHATWRVMLEDTHYVYDDEEIDALAPPPYKDADAFLDDELIKEIVNLTNDACSISSDICNEAIDEFDSLENESIAEDKILEFSDLYDALRDLSAQILAITGRDAFYEMAEFSEENYVNEVLQRDYSMEAYEENLDHYMELAIGQARNKAYDLSMAAQNDVEDFLRALKIFYEKFTDYIMKFVREIPQTVNPLIDNT